MTFGFLWGSRNFCKLLCFLRSILFYTDTPGSIEWLSPAPRLHIGDCFEIRNCHWGPCDLLLSSHQNFQLEVRLRHSVFCTGALVILVLSQISQFRSFWKWVLTLYLHKSSRLLNVGSKDTSWEELAWESPFSGISSSTNFSSKKNSCSHSGISEYNGSLRPFNNVSPPSFYGSFFDLFLEFYWLDQYQVSPIIHQP